MSLPVLSFANFSRLEQGALATRSESMLRVGHAFGCGRFVLSVCVLLSLFLHGVGGGLVGFRPLPDLMTDKLVLLDIVLSPAASLAVPATVAEAVTPPLSLPSPDPPSVRASVQTPVQAPVPKVRTMQKKEKSISAAQQKPRVTTSLSTKREHEPEQKLTPRAKIQTPVGQIIPREGATVLANESGQDTLKHGSEARFMHGVATEEFVEENYIGEYSMGKLGRVWIEDDRARSGHLILHAEGIGLTRPLFRFNRFIYVYGENPDSPDPILGSVTFFSDGYHIHQFLLQHNSTHAYYPRRN